MHRLPYGIIPATQYRWTHPCLIYGRRARPPHITAVTFPAVKPAWWTEAHVCEQLAQGCYLSVSRHGVEPATSGLQVRHVTVTLPSHAKAHTVPKDLVHQADIDDCQQRVYQSPVQQHWWDVSSHWQRYWRCNGRVAPASSRVCARYSEQDTSSTCCDHVTTDVSIHKLCCDFNVLFFFPDLLRI